MFRGLGFRDMPPIVENHMEKKMEDNMETRIMLTSMGINNGCPDSYWTWVPIRGIHKGLC